MSNSKRFLPRLRRYMDEGDRRQHRLGTLLYALSGVMCGIGLAIMMPATMALQSGDPQWGLTFWGWAVALAAVTVVGSTASFFGTKLSYAAGLGFMRNMQVVIGNKVSRLPLGWFKADSAGRLSRMVTQEMISTGQAAALYVGQLIKNAAAAIVFCAAVWLWSWQIGIMLTRFTGMRRKRKRVRGFRRAGHRREDSRVRTMPGSPARLPCGCRLCGA